MVSTLPPPPPPLPPPVAGGGPVSSRKSVAQMMCRRSARGRRRAGSPALGRGLMTSSAESAARRRPLRGARASVTRTRGRRGRPTPPAERRRAIRRHRAGGRRRPPKVAERADGTERAVGITPAEGEGEGDAPAPPRRERALGDRGAVVGVDEASAPRGCRRAWRRRRRERNRSTSPGAAVARRDLDQWRRAAASSVSRPPVSAQSRV